MVYQVMVLEICGTRQIKNPTDEQIQSELEILDDSNEDSFAILGSSKMTYIQISGDKNIGFVLEYQEGSVDAHFRATNDKITLNEVVKAFIDYRNGNPLWQKSFTFEKITW